MSVVDILSRVTLEGKASDIFIVAGRPLTYRANGRMEQDDETKLMPAQCAEYITAIYELAGGRTMDKLTETGDDDFSFALKGVARYRVSA
ncbi:MAG: type IV pili twitching motility protein PilT, partial [Lachnospiraceae bacterium]|nr:type IV pili twitching motility protein PilT [Lachnospiraceae bacterium]